MQCQNCGETEAYYKVIFEGKQMFVCHECYIVYLDILKSGGFEDKYDYGDFDIDYNDGLYQLLDRYAKKGTGM